MRSDRADSRASGGRNLFIYRGRAYRRYGCWCAIVRRTMDYSRVVVVFDDGFQGVVKRVRLEHLD